MKTTPEFRKSARLIEGMCVLVFGPVCRCGGRAAVAFLSFPHKNAAPPACAAPKLRAKHSKKWPNLRLRESPIQTAASRRVQEGLCR